MGKAFSTLLPIVKVSKCEILKFVCKTIRPQFFKCVKDTEDSCIWNCKHCIVYGIIKIANSFPLGAYISGWDGQETCKLINLSQVT